MKTIYNIKSMSRVVTYSGEVLWIKHPHIIDDYYGPYKIPNELLHELDNSVQRDLEFIDCSAYKAPMNDILAVLQRDKKVKLKLSNGETVTAIKYIKPLQHRYDDFLLEDMTTIAETWHCREMSYEIFGYWR